MFLHYAKRHKGLFFLDMFCALIVALIDLAFPFVSRLCMEFLIPQGAWQAFWAVMSVVVCAYVLRSVFLFIVWYWGISSASVSRRRCAETFSAICRP